MTTSLLFARTCRSSRSRQVSRISIFVFDIHNRLWKSARAFGSEMSPSTDEIGLGAPEAAKASSFADPSLGSAAMIFFSVGLPSPLVEWCDAVIARLAQCVIGPADIVSANTLEELGLALIKSQASHFVIASRLPSDGLRKALAENGTRFVVALDDPRAAFQNLVMRHGLDPIAATRAVAGSCASLLDYTVADNALVLRAEQEGRNPLGTAEAIARHFELDVGTAEVVHSVEALAEMGMTPMSNDISTWWDHLEDSNREIVDGALDGYIEHFAGRGLGKIIWARDLFVIGDDPYQPATRSIDITGRIRNLLFGPYMILPPGSWVATVVLGFSKEAAEMTYGIEFIAGPRCVSLCRTTIQPQGDRVFQATVIFTIEASTDQPISLRISNERAAFEGRLVLGSVTLSLQSKGRPEIPQELEIALDH